MQVHTSLVTLDVSCTVLKDTGFSQIAAALCQRRALTTLQVGATLLSNSSAKDLAAVLGQCPLTSLSIGAKQLESYAERPPAPKLERDACDQLMQVHALQARGAGRLMLLSCRSATG